MVTTQQIDRFVSEHSSLLSEKQIWVDRFEDIVDYVAPHYGTFQDIRQDLSTIGQDIFDTTAVNASLKYANGIQGNLVGKSLTWFKMLPVSQRLQAVKAIRDWMQKAESQIYSALDRSNFYEALNEFLTCGARFGTAVMYVEEDVEEGVIDFQPVHLREITLKEDASGHVIQVDREFYLTAEQAVDKFGAKNLPETLKTAADEKDRNYYRFLHIVSKRKQRDRSKRDSKNMPWSSLYLCVDVGDSAEEHLIRESGYRTFPYIVWRIAKPSRDPWGVSPAMDNLPLIIQINLMMKEFAEGIQLANQPPWLVSDTLLGLAERRPAVNIPVVQGEDIKPLNQGSGLPAIDAMLQRLDNSLKEAYFLDILASLTVQTKQMTVPEVQARVNEQATLLSPMVGRLESEVLDPVLDRVYDIESAAGRMPPVTQEMQNYGGANIRIDYIGPLAEAQRRYHASEGNQHALSLAMPFIQLAASTGKPNPADYLNTDKAFVNAMNDGGADSDIVLDKGEVDQIRNEKAKAAAAQAQVAAAATAASHYKDLTKAPENGSPAQTIQQQAQQQGGGQ